MGYRDKEFEEMRDNVHLGAGMLAVTLSQIDEERNKRIMGCRAAIHRDFTPSPGMYDNIGISIHITQTCDLVLKLTLIPMISSMNRSIKRAQKRGDVSSEALLRMSQEMGLKPTYEAFESIREAGFVNIDSYYDQWNTFVSRMGLDRSDKQSEDRGWSPTSEDNVEAARKAGFAQKDRDKKQGKEKKKGGWPAFRKLSEQVGTDDYGEPKVPEG